LPTNNRLGWKDLPGANTKAYYKNSELPAIKSIITLIPGRNQIYNLRIFFSTLLKIRYLCNKIESIIFLHRCSIHEASLDKCDISLFSQLLLVKVFVFFHLTLLFSSLQKSFLKTINWTKPRLSCFPLNNKKVV